MDAKDVIERARVDLQRMKRFVEDAIDIRRGLTERLDDEKWRLRKDPTATERVRWLREEVGQADAAVRTLTAGVKALLECVQDCAIEGRTGDMKRNADRARRDRDEDLRARESDSLRLSELARCNSAGTLEAEREDAVKNLLVPGAQARLANVPTTNRMVLALIDKNKRDRARKRA